MSAVIEFDKEQEGQRHGGRGECVCVCVCVCVGVCVWCVCVCVRTQTHEDTRNKEDYKSIFHILTFFSFCPL